MTQIIVAPNAKWFVRKNENLIFFWIIQFNATKQRGTLFGSLEPRQTDYIVPEDIPVLRNFPFLHNCIDGVSLHTSHKENTLPVHFSNSS